MTGGCFGMRRGRGVLTRLSGWLDRRRRERGAIAAAVRHFETSAGRTAQRGMASVIGADARGLVVRVCYGPTRPPRRTWYVVAPGGVVAAELTFAEAERFGERPWR